MSVKPVPAAVRGCASDGERPPGRPPGHGRGRRCFPGRVREPRARHFGRRRAAFDLVRLCGGSGSPINTEQLPSSLHTGSSSPALSDVAALRSAGAPPAVSWRSWRASSRAAPNSVATSRPDSSPSPASSEARRFSSTPGTTIVPNSSPPPVCIASTFAQKRRSAASRSKKGTGAHSPSRSQPRHREMACTVEVRLRGSTSCARPSRGHRQSEKPQRRWPVRPRSSDPLPLQLTIHRENVKK